jgi:hypothetical protein
VALIPWQIYHGNPGDWDEQRIERQRALEFIDWHNRAEGEPPLLFALYEFLVNDAHSDMDGSGDWCWCQNLAYDMERAGLITEDLAIAGW